MTKEKKNENLKMKNENSENFQRSEGTSHPTQESARKQTSKAQAHRAHISSTPLRHKEAIDWLPRGQREEQETSHYEWLDFVSSSRL